MSPIMDHPNSQDAALNDDLAIASHPLHPGHALLRAWIPDSHTRRAVVVRLCQKAACASLVPEVQIAGFYLTGRELTWDEVTEIAGFIQSI